MTCLYHFFERSVALQDEIVQHRRKKMRSDSGT